MKNSTQHLALSRRRTAIGIRGGLSTTVFLCRVLCAVCCVLSANFCLPVAEAAVSKGEKYQLDSGTMNQGVGTSSSSTFRQQASFGESLAGNSLTSASSSVAPDFLNTVDSNGTAAPAADLDIKILYAKTESFGGRITPQTWQQDTDPLFLWEPPAGGLELKGYSYAIDAEPDAVVDTTDTSFNVATSSLKTLTDGKHTFTVKAIDAAGIAGKPISIELWVDTTPPYIATYNPAPGGLLGKASPAVTATIEDIGSGVRSTTVSVFVNGSSMSTVFDETKGFLSAAGGTWKEGINNIELRVSDAVGNALAPLMWSVNVDTKPPVGSVLINGGAEMTTSAYVTLGLSATDATSGVAKMLVSNKELEGYVEEPYVALRELWKLIPVRGTQRVYVKFVDKAGNSSEPVSDDIDLGLLSPETAITSGPAGFVPERRASFSFMCPDGDCVFSYAFDNEAWSAWSPVATVTKNGLAFGNHYFRVKAAKDVNGTPDIQPDEEDPSPAERTWIVGVEPTALPIPKGPPVKIWRIE